MGKLWGRGVKKVCEQGGSVTSMYTLDVQPVLALQSTSRLLPLKQHVFPRPNPHTLPPTPPFPHLFTLDLVAGLRRLVQPSGLVAGANVQAAPARHQRHLVRVVVEVMQQAHLAQALRAGVGSVDNDV